ncbi:hypothetical protein BGZ61DRAFT_480446 [Ilyonectria robusta]|uniref:uncharacterized protein n=1 Tax=Ilyonectria robusta TaxID=1079257 RepID=UPI001E8E6E24|nr:uncharacterized protein BGZ61DRAFT_480446 [Ilyonectria robusta]KAH8684184.1 hypothetical protein BGZ61DRAFT_480446 [Ilyonectria robusta]
MEEDPAAMERIRADLIRRARIERHGELNMQEMQPTQPTSHRPFLRLFRRGQPPPQTEEPYRVAVESPKSPDLEQGVPDAPSRSFQFPNFARPWTARSNQHQPSGEPHPGGNQAAISSTESSTEPSSRATPSPRPPPLAYSDTSYQNDTLESRVAETVSDPGRQEHGRSPSSDQRSPRRRHHRSRHPKRFLFCIPWVKSKHLRAQILRTLVSGLIMLLLIIVYLALSVSQKVQTSEMTIMLILVILIATVFFFHGLLRLVIMIFKRKRVASGRTSLPETQIYGPRGYAVPNRPIQVVLARDEEAAGVESEAGKSKPPAYGLWRESVRVDPNRLFWQRNEAADEAQLRPTTRSGPRPPSYASDDGVSYVVEAAPRSTAPTVDVPLPTHPSEMGRVARMPRS